MIRTTKYFDSLSKQVTYQKPVRIVKAVQRSVPSPIINQPNTSLSMKTNVENQLILSSQYMRNLFPNSDQLKRKYIRQNSNNTVKITIYIRNFYLYILL